MAVLARISFFLAVFCIVSQNSVVHMALPSLATLPNSFSILTRGLCAPGSPLPSSLSGSGASTQSPLSPAVLQQIMSAVQAALSSLLGNGTNPLGGATLPGGIPTIPGGVPTIPGGVPTIPGGVPTVPGGAGGASVATTAAA